MPSGPATARVRGTFVTGLAVSDCDVMPGCVVDAGRCREQRCAYASTAESCDGVPVCVRLGEDACDAETLCSWNGSTCNSAQCSNYGSESACESDAGCAFIDGSCTDFPGRYCKAPPFKVRQSVRRIQDVIGTNTVAFKCASRSIVRLWIIRSGPVRQMLDAQATITTSASTKSRLAMPSNVSGGQNL